MIGMTQIDRRRFLQLAGGAAAAVTVTWAGKVLVPEAAVAAVGDPDLYLGGTDGWIYLPPTPAIPPFHPDNLAPAPFTTYMFGFRNVTGMSPVQRAAQKNKAQHSAPLFWVNQFDPGNPVDFTVTLMNLGLSLRPDLFDAHTVHWHGFRNVIPFFDGEPSGSVAVTTGREFTYVYRPRDPGTYMYHCHVEDVEHVQMGMTGLVFVRPLQDGNTRSTPAASTCTTTVTARRASTASSRCSCRRCGPRRTGRTRTSSSRSGATTGPTSACSTAGSTPTPSPPNGSIDPFNPVHDANGDLIAPAGPPELKYQPHSSLVTCNTGERVALRFANLGFREQAMTLAGIRMRVVGRDATPMRGRDDTDTSYETQTLNIGPGESYDVIFDAPPSAAAAAAAAPATTPTCSTTATTPGRTTWRRAVSAARPPRSASIPAGWPRRHIRTTGASERHDER